MAFTDDARTAAVTAALNMLRGPDPRIPNPANPEAPATRNAQLAELEEQLLRIAWSAINTGNGRTESTEVLFSTAVAAAQRWIDAALAPALAVAPDQRLCDARLLRALRAAVVLHGVVKPEEAHDTRARLVGTAATTAHDHGRTAPGGGHR